MKPVDQTIPSPPDGDCFRACDPALGEKRTADNWREGDRFHHVTFLVPLDPVKAMEKVLEADDTAQKSSVEENK